MSDVILEARGVGRELGETVKTRILDGIDLAVPRGQFLALTGASGSGKSTLLYLLGALDRPTRGRILVDGVDVGALDDDQRARLRSERLGFVFQFHFLLPELTVMENVLVPMLKRGLHPAEATQRSRHTLERLGLSALASRLPSQLSGGQQQRVSIARAIANRPAILLADEPTGSLDSANGKLVIETFEKLVAEAGLTIVLVTHETSFAARAHRQVSMRDGRIVADVLQGGASDGGRAGGAYRGTG